MANFCARFIPNFANIAEPLRRLTPKNAAFVRRKEHTVVFERIKELLTSKPVIAYFVVKKDTSLFVDASPIGISAILTQSTANETPRVIAYASRALTHVECRYPQRERGLKHSMGRRTFPYLFVRASFHTSDGSQVVGSYVRKSKV